MAGVNCSQPHSSEQETVHILRVNDDCLNHILRYLSLAEMAILAVTCKRFQNVARMAFLMRKKIYGIPNHEVAFEDHPLVLRNFGDLVKKASVINFPQVLPLSYAQIVRAFDWLERYCAGTLSQLTIFAFNDIVLPASAKRLISKLKIIDFHLPISFQNARTLLFNCNDLVELKMISYEGPFLFNGFVFPNLRKLFQRVRVDYDTDFGEMETFFENHTKLIELRTQFLIESRNSIIDLSFIGHLVDLEKLELYLSEAKVIGIDAFAHLKKLKELAFDHSKVVRTDLAILERLASHDLEKLTLGCSEVDQLIAGIGRFKNLSQLVITEEILPIFYEFKTNISSLAQIQNSRLTELKICCKKLLEPETIVDVIRNLSEVTIIKLFCEVNLSETICKELANVCSSQRRKVEIILCGETMNLERDFSFIGRFNEEHGQFVEIKEK